MTYNKIKIQFLVDVVIESNDDTTWRKFEKIRKEMEYLKLPIEGTKIVNAVVNRLLSEETYEVEAK